MTQPQHPPLSRHAALTPLSRDHYVGLVQAQHLKKAADADLATRRRVMAEFIEAWDKEIEQHFADEERLLPPLMTPSEQQRLNEEHAQLRRVAHQARDPHRQSDPDSDWLRSSGQLLEAHIRWEERQLFQAIQQRANDTQLEHLANQTQQVEAQHIRDGCRTRIGIGPG